MHENMDEESTVDPKTTPPAQLERVKGLAYGEFIQRYVLTGLPVVIEDAIEAWPAVKKWTPEFWVKRYGNRTVEIDGTSHTLQQVVQLALEPRVEGPPPYYRGIRIGHEYPELDVDLKPYPSCCSPNWFLNPIFRPLRRSTVTGVKGGATLDHRGGGKLDHPAVEWLNAAVRRRGQDAGVAAGWRAFLLCSRR